MRLCIVCLFAFNYPTVELLDILSVTVRRVEHSTSDTLGDVKITGERWNVRR